MLDLLIAIALIIAYDVVGHLIKRWRARRQPS